VTTAVILFFAASVFADDTNLTAAQMEGRALALQLCQERPQTNTALNGTLKIRDGAGGLNTMPIQFSMTLMATNWKAVYATPAGTNPVTLAIVRHGTDPAAYEMDGRPLSADEITAPFAGSDFWAMDLGLEFFHWPEQSVLKHEMRRGRSCRVLESLNPSPVFNNYSRVVSWIDNESSGIVHAEAYDFSGKLLKEFDPKSFKKVNGQWELENMEIRNDQTGSRTRIEFNFDDK
jgi:hypothetical protein